MTTSTGIIPDPGAAAVTLAENNWPLLLQTIDRAAEDFISNGLNSPTRKPSYYFEWLEFVTKAQRLLLDNPNAPFRDTCDNLHCDPDSLLQFGEALLNMVPPVKEVIKLSISKTRSQITLEVLEVTTVLRDLQSTTHRKWDSNDDDSSSMSSLKRRAKNLDDELSGVMNLSEEIATHVNAAIPDAVALAVERLKASDDNLNKVTIEHAKLAGDIKKAEKDIQSLRGVSTTIQDQASKATEVLKKELATFRSDVKTLTSEGVQEVKDIIVTIPSQQYNPQPPHIVCRLTILSKW